MGIVKVKDSVTEAELETIAELASQNYGPRDIALNLRMDMRGFMHVWRDKKSRIREAYERGVMEIDIIKREKLNKEVEGGSITAIQIHDKRSEAQRFEDIKREIFSFE